MTGFGSGEAGYFRVEVRSLNHRFMDVYVRCPQVLNRHEIPLRELLRARFSRGKFDVFVSFSADGGPRLKLDRQKATEIMGALRELNQELSIPGQVGLEALLAWKDLLFKEETELDTEDLYRAFEEAVAGLEAMRLEEGKGLAEDLLARADKVDELTGKIMERSPAVMDSETEKFRTRLAELLGGGAADDPRILQEAASYAERMDISEEVTRLKGHIEHMRKILLEDGAVGRKLDFLIQELHREANTIASKSDDPEVLGNVIMMKSEIERAREQAQNIQ